MLRVATLLFALMLGPVFSGAALAQSESAEITFWNSIKDSADAEEFRAYLESFPDGSFAPLARIRIRKLDAGETPAAKPASSPRREPETAANPPAVENDIGYVGARIANLTARQAKDAGLGVPQGALIEEVVPGGPADRAGLVAKDIVIKIGDVPVADNAGFLQLTKDLEPGTKTQLEIVRSGRRQVVSITVGGFVADNLAAAMSGDTRAMVWLYGIYISDRLGEPDTGEALRWLNEAVDAGDASASHTLAALHWDGNHLPKDQQKARQFYQRAADRGYMLAQKAMGQILYAGLAGEKDPALALTYYRQAADAGDLESMYQVAEMYLNGNGTAKNAGEAARWFRQAADAGHARAMVDLAIRYHIGDGVTRDYAEAARWYNRGLEAGQTGGLFNMSLLYSYGQGVAKDEKRAAGYVIEAIKSGDAYALEKSKANASSWSKSYRRHLQSLLKSEGVYDGKIDGSIGPQSRQSFDLLAQKAKQRRDQSAAAKPAQEGAGSAGVSVKSKAGDSDLGLGTLEDLDSLE